MIGVAQTWELQGFRTSQYGVAPDWVLLDVPVLIPVYTVCDKAFKASIRTTPVQRLSDPTDPQPWVCQDHEKAEEPEGRKKA